mmetsp:Transcript_8840/g.24480  ORF Transcript_8840/g.24480 Transcript_8840/m.24480 type:complete len:803 (+) Transcript_8840:68-2476(+)|eukprot:CAMPEP_0168754720 /NCGR_PEP_ID=MMETSP0724-20121128/19654_1 /TAXON_ID=265536 /ORGANISM="Amphiprora sp., Strain CCMP467" /LENGTH=802 /DNA_ID=CAMNT_0008803223 /DNA_START=49 /DNA_END=2457 /DNA_ORIENTATION=-
MSVVGVDLGYQNSVISAAGRGGVDILLNGNSNRLNPSMVGFGENRKMGEHATSGVTSNFKNTIKGMKRLLGLPFDSAAAKLEMRHYPGVTFVPYQHSKGGPSTIAVQVDFANEKKVVPMEHVAGMMVHHMGTIAAQKASETSKDADISKLFPQDWVVAIPPYWTDAQRRALLAGCEMVGIPTVQRLMHENTAVALNYGIFKDLRKEFTADKPTHVMFIDMGASAYTVSIASFEPGKLKVLACYSDPNLGGRDFDLAIGNWVAKKFEDKYGKKLSAKPMEKPKTRIKILAAAEKAKKTLSPQGVKEASINLEMLQDDFDFHAKLKAAEYEEMCQPLLDRLEGPIVKCLMEAKLESSALSTVEIVGGSTRIASLKRRLMQILKVNTLATTMNADEAVAKGVGLQSAILSPRFKVLPYDIEEAQPYPVNITWGTDESSSVVMFDRGLSFPVTRRVTLKKSGDFTVSATYKKPETVEAYGLDPTLADSEVASFAVKGPKEEKKIRVNVKQDIHGVIQLSSVQMIEEAEEEGGEEKEGEGEEAKKKKVTKTSLESSTKRPFDWTAEDISKQFEEETSMANTDRVVKETADMRNELESYIYDMRDKIISESHLGPYGTADEKDAYTKLNEQTENWLYEDGFDATKKVYAEKLAALKKLGSPLEKRQAEATGRSAAQASLQATLDTFQNWVNESQNDEKYKHISDDERQIVHKLCDDISAWMYEMLDKQGDLPLHADAILTVADMQAKQKELNEKGGQIMRKPVPKPPKVPTPPASDEAKPEANGGDAPKEGEPMDVDGEEAKEGMEVD